MDSTLVPYLSTSGRGHGILYTNHGPKATTLSYLDPSSIQIGRSAGQKDHGGFIHGTTIRGGEKRAESRQAKPVKFVPVNFSPGAGEILTSRSTAGAFSPIQEARHNSQPNCYDELDSLPYYVCEDLVDIWIGIIQPGMMYRAGSEPIWWPENIPFKRPQCLRKFEKLHLLATLLDGKLQEVATAHELKVAATLESDSISGSEKYQETLERIFRGCFTRRKSSGKASDRWLEVVLEDNSF